MLENFVGRLSQAVVFAGMTFFGVKWIGATGAYPVALALAVAACFVFARYTQYVASASFLVLIWGGLVWAGVAPSASVAVESAKSLAGLAPKLSNAVAPASSLPLEGQLTQLKDACDHHLLSPTECSEARAKIVSQFARK